MAGSLAAAMVEAEAAYGSKFDVAIGLSPPPHPVAPTPELVRRAFAGFDYRHIRGIARSLVRRYRCAEWDAEEAIHDALEFLLDRRTYVFAQQRERWLRFLHGVSRFRLLQIRSGPKLPSLEALREAGGDTALAGATALESAAPGEPEDARGASLPGPGEEWTDGQIIGALQRFGDRHERPPTARECRRLQGLPSYSTLLKRFGGFREALRAAGMLAPPRHRRRWTTLDAARACFSFRLRHGHWPEPIDLRLNPDLPSRSVMIRCFGSTRSGEVQEQAEAILGLSR